MVPGRRLTALALLLAAFASPARADEPPRVSGSLVNYIENDWYARSTSEAQELNDLYLSSNLYTAFRLDERFTINTELKLDTVRSAGDDRYFADEGLWLRQLTLDFQQGPLSLFAGKHTLPFGQAFDLAPGIFGAIFADDYKLVEHLAFGGKLAVPDNAAGITAVNTEVAMLDSTALSTVLGARAPFTASDAGRVKRMRRSHGGAGNTGDFSSLLLGTEGKLGTTGWTLTGLHRRDGAGGTDPENGLAFTLLPAERTIGTWTLTGIGETVHLWNYNGGATDQRNLLLGAQIARGGFFVTGVGSLRHIDRRAAADDDDHQLTFSTGYNVTPELAVETGWQRTQVGNVRTDVIGFLLTIIKAF